MHHISGLPASQPASISAVHPYRTKPPTHQQRATLLFLAGIPHEMLPPRPYPKTAQAFSCFENDPRPNAVDAETFSTSAIQCSPLNSPESPNLATRFEFIIRNTSMMTKKKAPHPSKLPRNPNPHKPTANPLARRLFVALGTPSTCLSVSAQPTPFPIKGVSTILHACCILSQS